VCPSTPPPTNISGTHQCGGTLLVCMACGGGGGGGGMWWWWWGGGYLEGSVGVVARLAKVDAREALLATEKHTHDASPATSALHRKLCTVIITPST
jgi:hypothetical protein